mmetsp:Transcript_10406/g.26190  ORF Transcript_10406/g.26190 Transcript_10406/m.26190 type:complete len:262 (-) Transcript_10406:1911-2696(-)
MISAAFSQSLMALPTPEMRNRRQRKDSNLSKRSVSMNLPMTEMTLLPIYLRSTNIESSVMNSRIISWYSNSGFVISASPSPFCSSPSFKLALEGFLGKLRTPRHRRSMWLIVAHVSSEIELVLRSLVTKISSLRKPFTANAPESEMKQLLNIAKISSIKVSSLNNLMERRQMWMQSSMNRSKVVSTHEELRFSSSDFSAFFGDRKRSISVGSRGTLAVSDSSSPNSNTELKIPRYTSCNVWMYFDFDSSSRESLSSSDGKK